ncbi:MAG: ChaN family lipoprotein [Flavobacteriales bacterium]|nr:ChaN family lipoprotein [Flavobacteriales bacterium]
MKKIILILLLFVVVLSTAQDKAYEVYNASGKKVKFSAIHKKIQASNVVFFGELHDNPIAHWLELEVAKFMVENNQTVTFGAEMFERDEQIYLDKYLAGELSDMEFDSLAGLWNNFFTDYLPVVDLAKNSNSKFIATNVVRRYASQVYKYGLESLDTLSAEVKSNLAPLPIEFDINVKCYKEMMEMMGGHGGENFPKAQAIKDATMAYFIITNYQKSNDAKFFHMNGSYHSDNHEGIIWYLKRYAPDLSIMNITVVLQSDISKLNEENKGKADFIIVVDEDMTSTYR